MYVLAFKSPGVQEIARLDKHTLREEASRRVGDGAFHIAYGGGKLYVTDGFESQSIDVYDAATLEPLGTLDVSAGVERNQPSAAFGFLAPGVLLLNEHAWLNTQTGEVVADGFPLSVGFASSLRFPEGRSGVF